MLLESTDRIDSCPIFCSNDTLEQELCAMNEYEEIRDVRSIICPTVYTIAFPPQS